MNLRLRRFERAARAAVRQALRASPALRQEHRRVRRRGQAEASGLAMRILVTLALCFFTAKAASLGAPAEGLLGVLTLWNLCFAFHYAHRLRTQLYQSHDVLVLALQPVSDQAIFQTQWHRFVRMSGWLLLDNLAALTVVLWHLDAGALESLAGAACGAALWLSVLSSSALLVSLRPAAAYGVLSSILILMLGAVFAGVIYTPQPILDLLRSTGESLFFVPPFGWIAYVLRYGVLGNDPYALAALLPIALLAPGLQFAKNRIVEGYQIEFSELPADNPEIEEEDLAVAVSAVDLPESARSALDSADRIRNAWARQALAWPARGVIEKLLGAWLSPREKTIAQFLTTGQFHWTQALIRASILMMAAVLGGLSFGEAGRWVFYVGVYFSLNSALPGVSAGYPGLISVHVSGAAVPLYAFVPLSFAEISRLLLKVAAVRTGAVLPLALVAGGVGGYLRHLPWTDGCIYGLKFQLLLMAWQPLLIVYQFSAGTNDTRNGARSSLKMFGAFAPLVILALALSAAGFFLPGWQAAAALACLTLTSWAALRLYGWFYRGRTFDLMQGHPQ